MAITRKKVNPAEGFTPDQIVAWNKAIDHIKSRLNGYRDVEEDGNTGNYQDVIKMEDFSTFMDNLKVSQ